MIWVGLRSGGDLARIDPVSGEITVYSFQGAGLAPIPSSGVVSIQEDQDGALWLGTNKLGLVKLTRDRKQAIWYQSNPDDPNGLGGDLVVGLYRDRENSFWSTTKAGDVYRFQPQSPGFRSYRHQRGNPHSLDEGSVTAAYVEDQNTLWIGTDRGLNRVDRRTDQVTRYDEPIFRRGVRAIAKDRRGSLWFGTGGNGLVRFDPPSGRYRIYAHMASDPRTLSYDTIGALWIDRGGTLWVATDFGLNRFDPATEEFRRYSPQPKSLTQYRSIAEEPGGALWLATSSHGLHRFDPGTGTFTTFEHRLREQHSRGHNRVNSVHVDGSGTVWAATLRGLAKFNPRDGTFTSYDSRSGLPTDAALGILEAENGHLWVSTQDGLSRFDPRAQTFTNFHTSDGLLTDLFDVPVVATRSPSGEMFFGSHSGLVAFFPDQVTEEKFAAPVVLTDFRLFGEPVEAGKKPLKQPIWSATSLELEARSIFSFDFSALNYVDPARTRYRYRLEGLESKWNETGSSRRTVTYTTLPAGNYTLRVQARASRGDWNESRVALKIRILPPWYATWYFRSLCAAVLLTMLWLAYQRRVQQLQRRSRELRDMIETIPAMAWTARPDGSNSIVNRRWAEFTGLSADDSAASGWTDAVHPEDRQAYAAEWRASLATGEPFESEARFLCVDGEYRWLLARAVPSRDAHGKIVRWYGLLADIADRKRAETELRASEQRFRTLVEFSFDVYWETDAQHRFTRQEFAEGLAGPPPGSEIGTTRWDVPYLEPDEEAWRKHRAMLDAHLPFRDFELARPTPDGGTRNVSVSGLPVFDSTGRFLGYRGVGRDITDRKRAEQALRDSEIRFRTFVDHAADAFFMLDFERATILDVNQYACESLGYTREELIGMTPLAFDVDLNRATLESIATRAAAGETVLFNRHLHRRKDGATFPVEVQTSVFWHGGRRFLLKVARNISDRVQAEEEHEKLRQLEADLAHINRVSMMGELAASIAHEVNQPLSGVVSNGSACLRWLAGDVPNLDEARDAARRIVRDGKRAGEVVARVRALTRRDTKATEALT
jgi:PAS domain S-box-containing protein